MKLLDDDEIRTGLDGLPGWERRGDAIHKSFGLGSFREALDFVNRVGELAERADHHPDMDIRYDTVALALSTHSEGGLTRKDLDLARSIEDL